VPVAAPQAAPERLAAAAPSRRPLAAVATESGRDGTLTAQGRAPRAVAWLPVTSRRAVAVPRIPEPRQAALPRPAPPGVRRPVDDLGRIVLVNAGDADLQAAAMSNAALAAGTTPRAAEALLAVASAERDRG